jgi:hypothetical protein
MFPSGVARRAQRGGLGLGLGDCERLRYCAVIPHYKIEHTNGGRFNLCYVLRLGGLVGRYRFY